MADETPRQLPARRGFSVSYKGKPLLSTMDPAALADRAVDALGRTSGFAPGTLYFCPSPLYGYGLRRLLDNISPDSAVLCVEADEKLLALSMDTIDKAILAHPRFRLTQAQDPASLCFLVREAWGSRRFRRVEQLRLTGGWQLDAGRYDALADALRRDIALDWGNAMTLVKLGRRYARNALRNLSLLPRAPRLSALSFGSAPTLVLGAGPSLDGLLDGLSSAFGDLSDPAKRPFRIICVDTSLSPLHARGIKPDLAVALESQHWNLRDFVGLGTWETPVAMDLSALPATGEGLGGQPRLFFTPWTRLSLFSRLRSAGLLPEQLPPLGSVGLSAVAIACRLTAGPIIVGGIDFSFTLDQSHARSAPAHLEKLRRQTRLQSLIDPAGSFRRGCHAALSKSGESVRSNRAMENYRDLFRQEFAMGPAPNDRIRDIAGSGLDLGLETLAPEAAFAVLAKGTMVGKDDRVITASDSVITTEAVHAFIEEELASLARLRDTLMGERAAPPAELETLLDRCDYLWAHFPDCAAADGRHPPASDIAFLKRVRAEIDPFITLLQITLRPLPRGRRP